MKRTPLYEQHVALGGKMVDFGGWLLPVQYTGILEEHRHVRTAAGLFDVSHMGEIRVGGKHAGAFLQILLTNDIQRTAAGRAVYSPMCYPDGGIVDDLIVYQLGDQDFLLVVNAANTAKDLDWVMQNAGRFRHEQAGADISFEDVSDGYAQLALQGPGAETILQRVCPSDLSRLSFMGAASQQLVAGERVLLSRTGYTGEDGFEIYLDPAKAVLVWDVLLEAGRTAGLVPAGLGARDSLRLEAALPLYGQDISAAVSPLEAGLANFVKLQKDHFIGKASLQHQAVSGLKQTRIGLVLADAGVMRSQYGVFDMQRPVGHITSGGFSPTLQKSIGLALVDPACAAAGRELAVEIRGRQARAQVVRLPFYDKKYQIGIR